MLKAHDYLLKIDTASVATASVDEVRPTPTILGTPWPERNSAAANLRHPKTERTPPLLQSSIMAGAEGRRQRVRKWGRVLMYRSRSVRLSGQLALIPARLPHCLRRAGHTAGTRVAKPASRGIPFLTLARRLTDAFKAQPDPPSRLVRLSV